jgi:hypothetical protein
MLRARYKLYRRTQEAQLRFRAIRDWERLLPPVPQDAPPLRFPVRMD